jgi:hypothetical protein
VEAHVIGTLQQLKDYIGEVEDKSDERLTAALQAATSWVNAYCRRRSFELATYTAELCDGTGTDTLQLDVPIVSVSAVLEGGSALVVGVDPNANPTPDVIWYGNEGHLVRPFGCFFAYRRFYSVTYSAGYAPDDIPPIVLQACLDQAALIVREKSIIGIDQKNIGQQSTTYRREIPKAIKDGLDFYRDLAINRRIA